MLLLATWLDGVAFNATFVGHTARKKVETRDWYQFLRAVGYWPTWIALWLAITLAATPRMWFDRARLPILLAPGLAGLVAELLKLIVARQRPIHNGVGDAEYVYRGLFSGFVDGKNLGLPSSHAAVAAAGAFALIAWRPRLWPVALLLMLGCMATRMLSGAHFLSDVALAGVVAWVIWRLLRPGGWWGGWVGEAGWTEPIRRTPFLP